MPPLSWPSLCAVCRGWSHARLCADCSGRFVRATPRCARCALASPTATCGACLRVPPPFSRAVAAFDYAYPWDTLLTAFKFRAALDLSDALATLLAEAVRRAAAPVPALLLPMPLGPARLRARGYNQAWELTRRVARRLGAAADPALLVRPVDTPEQSGLQRDRRDANVRGCFAVDPRARSRLAGLRVALVDDVMTTGATAREAARCLLANGAAEVQVWVAARTAAT